MHGATSGTHTCFRLHTKLLDFEIVTTMIFLVGIAPSWSYKTTLLVMWYFLYHVLLLLYHSHGTSLCLTCCLAACTNIAWMHVVYDSEHVQKPCGIHVGLCMKYCLYIKALIWITCEHVWSDSLKFLSRWICWSGRALKSSKIKFFNLCCSKATTLEGSFAPAWLGFGNAYAAQDESDQAMAAYRTAARLFAGYCHIFNQQIIFGYFRSSNRFGGSEEFSCNKIAVSLVFVWSPTNELF